MFNEQMLVNITILLFFVLVLYLVLIRPQMKRLNQHNKTLAMLKKGDNVLTMGGIVGTIVDFEGKNIVVIEVSKGHNIRVVRKMIETHYIDLP